MPATIHRIDAERFLRFDLTVPILLAARGRPAGARLLAGGKVFRDDAEDRSHLQAFHQAELLWTGERLSPWSAMDCVAGLLDDLLPGARVRVEEVDYPLYADRGYEVSVQHGDDWVAVAGWACFTDEVVRNLGLDPSRETALGAGLGLERIAGLRYDIDDVRRVASSTVAHEEERP